MKVLKNCDDNILFLPFYMLQKKNHINFITHFINATTTLFFNMKIEIFFVVVSLIQKYLQNCICACLLMLIILFSSSLMN